MKNVIITILSILVLGLGCFIVYDKVINKEDKIEISVENNSIDTLNFSNRLSLSAFGETLGKDYSELKDININDLSDKDLIYLAVPEGKKVELTENEKTNYAYHFQIKESDYVDSIKKVFGERAKNIDFEKIIGDGLKVHLEEYKYNKENKTIERYILNGGFDIYQSNIEKIDLEGDKLYLYEDVSIMSVGSNELSYNLKFTYMLNGDNYTFYRLQSYEKSN